MKLYTQVLDGAYFIASLPFNTAREAYEEIRTYRQDVDCTVYFDAEERKYYIIEHC